MCVKVNEESDEQDEDDIKNLQNEKIIKQETDRWERRNKKCIEFSSCVSCS